MGTEFASANLTAGQLNAIVKKLGGHNEALKFLREELEVRQTEHIIDLDAKPLIPYDGWQAEEHKPGGKLKWNPEQVALHLSPNQQNGKSIEGNKLRKELAKQAVFNANLLDYLLDHPQLIPESWKQDEKGQTRYIYFWGTIYRDSVGRPCVRYLCWSAGRWQADDRWLGYGWDEQCPAAVPASQV